MTRHPPLFFTLVFASACVAPLEVDDDGATSMHAETAPAASYTDTGAPTDDDTAGPYPTTAPAATSWTSATTGGGWTDTGWDEPTYSSGLWTGGEDWDSTAGGVPTAGWDTEGSACWGLEALDCGDTPGCAWLSRYVVGSRVSCELVPIGGACLPVADEDTDCGGAGSCAGGGAVFFVDEASEVIVPMPACGTVEGFSMCIPGSPSPQCACACANPPG
jgi:hypothetical protein